MRSAYSRISPQYRLDPSDITAWLMMGVVWGFFAKEFWHDYRQKTRSAVCEEKK